MALVPEYKLFGVCIDSDKKQIMIDAIGNYLESLQKSQASRIKLYETQWLKEEIEKMKVCIMYAGKEVIEELLFRSTDISVSGGISLGKGE